MAYVPIANKDNVFEVLAKDFVDPDGRDRGEWLERLAGHDLFAELMIHIAQRRYWPDYMQLVRMITNAIEGELDDIGRGQA
jgi:hypothetical protein